MLKSELIRLLEALPGDPEILVDGYEGGATTLEPSMVFEDVVFRNGNAGSSYTGLHRVLEQFSLYEPEDLEEFMTEHPESEPMRVIRLSRKHADSFLAQYEPCRQYLLGRKF